MSSRFSVEIAGVALVTRAPMVRLLCRRARRLRCQYPQAAYVRAHLELIDWCDDPRARRPRPLWRRLVDLVCEWRTSLPLTWPAALTGRRPLSGGADR